MPRAAVVTLVPARYGSYEPSTARWRIGARPAGFANTAPASPTSATPAPPNPAERVEPGRAARALPWEARDVDEKTSRRTVKKRREGMTYALPPRLTSTVLLNVVPPRLRLN